MNKRGHGFWELAGLGAAVALSAAGAIVQSATGPAPRKEKPVRLVVIGVRGLDWNLVRDWRTDERGTYRFLKWIEESDDVAVGDITAGGYGDDAEVLASLVTGRFPFKHGVRSFRDGALFEDQPNAYRRPVWDELGRQGHRVVVAGHPFATPGRDDRVVVVPDRYGFPIDAHLDEEDPWKHLAVEFRAPPANFEEGVEYLVRQVAGDEPLDAARVEGLRNCIVSDAASAEALGQMLRDDPERHGFLYLQGLHRWIHDYAAEGELVGRYYEMIDRLVGGTSMELDENDLLVVFSERANPDGPVEHFRDFPRLETWPPVGFFATAGGPIRRSAPAHTLAPVDLAPTLLWAAGAEIPNDMDGFPQFGWFEEEFYFERRLAFRP